jgi:hypothetical protein
MRALSFVTPYSVLAATVFTALLLRRRCWPSGAGAAARRLQRRVGHDRRSGPRFAPGRRRGAGRWSDGGRFDWTARDASRFTSAVHSPALYELVEERPATAARDDHGLTGPHRARALWESKLWTFLHARAARTPSVREMTEIVGDMEKI